MVATTVDAQSAADTQDHWIAVIDADDVPLRCGANDTYYPLGHAKRGTLVKVVGEKHSWARIAAVGPAFADLFGHVKYTPAEAGRFRKAADGRTVRTMGRVEVLAPNINEKADPRHSWRPVARLGADVTLEVLETTRLGEETVLTVRLPEEATVWVSMAQLRRASNREIQQWEQLSKRSSAPSSAQGTPTGTPEQNTTSTDKTNAEKKTTTLPNTRAADQRAASQGELPTVTSLDQLPPARSNSGATKPNTGDATVLATPESDLPIVSGPDLSQVTHADGTTERIDRPADGATHRSVKRLDSEPREELKAIEQAFKALEQEPLETAEVIPLRNVYLEYADRVAEEYPRLASYARARAEQLAIWETLQQRKRDLVALRQRIDRAGDDVERVNRVLQGTGSYTAVGRLTASTIYDGSRLPQLLRLQDPGTGRTVAYLEPDSDFDLTAMLDQLIGIMGDRQYDPSLRLNLIRPRRIDLLAPQAETDSTTTTGSATSITAAASDAPDN